MNERIIDIILYLVTQIRQKTPIEQIDIKRLVSDGYTDAEIGAAFSWLADRTDYGQYDPLTRPRTTFRVLHESERMLFRQDAYGYMLQLVEIGLFHRTYPRKRLHIFVAHRFRPPGGTDCTY